MKHFIFLTLLTCFITACTSGPRSSLYCYSEAKSAYIKCPNGYTPGDTIPRNK